MPMLIIDGEDFEVEDGLTLIQACELAGIEFPVFVTTSAYRSLETAGCASLR